MNAPEHLTLAQGRALLNEPPKRANKYGAVRTELDGIVFDSGREASVWAMLKLRERCGEIKNLRRQVRFKIFVNNVLIYTYRADFAFDDLIERRERIIDVKSEATAKARPFLIVQKLMRAVYGIEVEVWL